MTTCPAAVTIDGKTAHDLLAYLKATSKAGDVDPVGEQWRYMYALEEAMPSPPAPLTLVEWLEQEVPTRAWPHDSDGYNLGRQAVLDAAARWEPPAPEPVDVDALGFWMAENICGHAGYAARAVVEFCGREAQP